MHRRAFTLIELLVVISIIALLSSVVLASLNSAREKARLAAGKQFDSIIKHGIGDQLAGEWLFDNASNPYLDSAGLTTATCGSCPTLVAGHNGNTAGNFASGNYLSAQLVAPAAGTLSVWVKTTSGDRIAIGSQISGLNRSYIGIPSQGVCGGGVGSDTWVLIRGITRVDDGAWHHCAVTYDGSKVKLYADGKIEYSGNQNGGAVSGLQYYIGAQNQNDSPTNQFIGTIDDVRVYSTALTSSEIGALYANEAKKFRFAGDIK